MKGEEQGRKEKGNQPRLTREKWLLILKLAKESNRKGKMFIIAV